MITGDLFTEFMDWEAPDEDFLHDPPFFVHVSVACPHTLEEDAVEWTMFEFAQRFSQFPESVAEANALLNTTETQTDCAHCPAVRVTGMVLDREGTREITFNAPRPGGIDFLSYWGELVSEADRDQHWTNTWGNITTYAAAVMRELNSDPTLRGRTQTKSGPLNLADAIIRIVPEPDTPFAAATVELKTRVSAAVAEDMSIQEIAEALVNGDPKIKPRKAREIVAHVLADINL